MNSSESGDTPVAERLVDEHLLDLLRTPSNGLTAIIVQGVAGNGVRTLIRQRIPELIPERTVHILAGEWPDLGSQEAVLPSKAVLLSESVADIPLAPPPNRACDMHIVVGCHSVESLPEWVRTLSDKSRTIVQLNTLSHAELQAFCVARLHGPVASSAVREIGSICGFVPAQVAALIRVLVQEGVLMRVDETWLLVSPIDTKLFLPTLRNTLTSFDEPEVTLFLRLCLVGVEECESPSSGSRKELRTLELAGLVTVATDGRGEVRSRLLAEVGQQLADPVVSSNVYIRTLQRPNPPEQAVLWALRHDYPIATEAVHNVLQHLLNLHEWRAALYLSGLALQVSESSPNTNVRHNCKLLLAQAVALRFLDQPDEAIAVLADAEHLAVSLPETDELRVLAVVQRAEIVHYKIGDVDGALAALRAAYEASPPQHRGDLAGHYTLHLLYAGRFQEASSSKKLDAHEPASMSRDLRTRIAIAQCLALAAEGRIRNAFRRAIQIGARRFLSTPRAAWVTEELSVAYFVSAFRKNGPAQLPKLMRQFEGKDAHIYRPDDTTFQLVRATWLLAVGNLPRAEQESATCYANMKFHDPSGLAQAVAALRAHTIALRGDLHTSRVMIAESERLPPRSGAVVAGGASAHLCAARYLIGEVDASSNTLLTAEEYISAGCYGFAAEVLYSGVRFGDRKAAAALIAIWHKIDGPLVELHIAHAQAVHSSDPVALMRAGESLRKAGLLLNAFEAYGLVGHLSQITVVPKVTAKRASYEAHELSEKMQLLVHPFYIKRAATLSEALTPREKEVQQLILVGLTNREIAERLSLSIRTVEGHVSRLYRKTGEERRDPGRRITTTN